MMTRAARARADGVSDRWGSRSGPGACREDPWRPRQTRPRVGGGAEGADSVRRLETSGRSAATPPSH